MSDQKKVPLPALSLEGKYVLALVTCPVCHKPWGFDCWGVIVKEFPDGILKLKVREAGDSPQRSGMTETYGLEDALDWAIRDTQQALADEFMRLVRATELNRRECSAHKPHNAPGSRQAGGPSKNHWAGPWRAQDATEVPWDELRGSDS